MEANRVTNTLGRISRRVFWKEIHGLPICRARMIDGLGSWSMNIDRNNNKSKAESSLSFLSALIRPIGCCVREFILSTSPSENWYSISIASRLFCTAPLVIYIQDRVDNWAGPQNIRNPLSLSFLFLHPRRGDSLLWSIKSNSGARQMILVKKERKCNGTQVECFVFFPLAAPCFGFRNTSRGVSTYLLWCWPFVPNSTGYR